MTKKDYIALANAISTFNDPYFRTLACAVIGMVLQRDNPAFDMKRFVPACGVTEGQATTAREKFLKEHES